MIRRTLLAYALCTISLTGCTTPTALLSSAEIKTQALSEDLPLYQMPAQQIVVPKTRSRAPQSITNGNSATLHVSPKETFPALLSQIRNAEHSIYLETFSFAYDEMGQQIVPLLIEKARSGVEVKVMMDYVGSHFFSGHKSLLKALTEGGIKVLVYKPRTVIKDNKAIGINITHRKVYLVDGETALVGGVNLNHPFDTKVQDILIKWQGPVVEQLYSEFAYDWRAAGGDTLGQTAQSQAVRGGIAAQLTVTSPAEGRFETRDLLFSKIDAAKNEILIQNQYFCDDRFIEHLHKAIQRGVKVKIMVPGKTDSVFFKNVHAEELLDMVKEGGEVRLYHGDPEDSHLHVKYCSVDNGWATTGSTNDDTRAFLDNQELNLSFTDPTLVSGLRQRLFMRDWEQFSEPFVYRKPSLFTRIFRTLLEAVDYYI